MPVGFKNATDGSVQVAIDAIRCAAYPHCFLSVTKQSVAAIVETAGNEDCHVILRGGASGPNYDSESLAEVGKALDKAGLPNRVMVDCSHGNSDKDFTRQSEVAAELASQIAAGDRSIIGLMMESFLVDGRQDYRKGVDLVYGQSVTDACMGWERTEPLFGLLAEAVQRRREG
jgi:3-deoxy-7-phosphoheptulonate synthase